MKKLYKSSLGFTLVELLIVISILSILVSLVIVSFRSSQLKGHDAERKSDLKQIANALELYYNDYGKYPNSLPPWGSTFTDGKTVYFKVLPKDPVAAYSYYYRVVDPAPGGNDQKYQLFAHLENSQDQELIVTTYSCGGTTCNFAITSPNTTPSE